MAGCLAMFSFYLIVFGEMILIYFSWNNGLREAVVTDTFLFLSTFFVQSADPIVI
jgi:hypothetical protein